MSSFYVSPTGNDGFSGSESAPFQSLERALRTSGENDEIILRGGVYQVYDSALIGQGHSGLTLRAFEGETPVLDGSVPLEAKDFVRLDDVKGERFASACRIPEESRANVWVYDLKAHGIPTGTIYKNGFNWPLRPVAPELVADGEIQTLAGWPKGRAMTRAEILIGREIKGRENSHTPDEHARYITAMHSGARQGGVPRAYFFDKTDSPMSTEEMLKLDAPVFYTASDELKAKAQAWLPRDESELKDGAKYETDAWLKGYFENNYADDMSRMRAYDPQRRLLYLEHPTMQGVQDYWLKLNAMNVLGELSAPGEYYIDRFNGNDVLYYYPNGGSIDGKRISFTALTKPALRIENASGVTLSGISFTNGTGNALELMDCEHCVISDCEISNFALDAIRIGETSGTITADPAYATRRGGHNNTVKACYIHDMGGGGVFLAGGDPETLERANHAVMNCEFYRLSNKRTYSPAVYLEGVGSSFTDNYVHSSPHVSVHIMGNDMLVRGNLIEDVCLNASDQGAIYAGRCFTWLGNVIEGNVVRNVGGRDNHGIYWDDGMSGGIVRGNVFENISGHCLFMNSGHDHVLEDNVFICSNSAVRLWGYESKRPIPNEKTHRFRWNARFAKPEVKARWVEHYRRLYPRLDRLYFPEDDGVYPDDPDCVFAPARHTFARNVIIGSESLHNGTEATLKYYEKDFGKPLFTAMTAGEAGFDLSSYRFNADSPVNDAPGFGKEWTERFNKSITAINPSKQTACD